MAGRAGLVEQPDGGAEAVYSVCHVGDLVQEVLRAGGLVEVIEPAGVRERVRVAAGRLMGRHA